MESNGRGVLDTRVRGYDDCLWGPIFVVPAKAGTHNHRTLCCAKVVQQPLLMMGRCV
jgi:hypothetical protein